MCFTYSLTCFCWVVFLLICLHFLPCLWVSWLTLYTCVSGNVCCSLWRSSFWKHVGLSQIVWWIVCVFCCCFLKEKHYIFNWWRLVILTEHLHKKWRNLCLTLKNVFTFCPHEIYVVLQVLLIFCLFFLNFLLGNLPAYMIVSANRNKYLI